MTSGHESDYLTNKLALKAYTTILVTF